MEKFTAYKCESCGKITVLKRGVCIDCKGRNFSQIDLEERGRPITFTKLYATPEGIEEMPLILGIVELEGNTKLTTQITDPDVKIGDELKPVWGKLRKRQGKEIYGFKFHPIK